MAFATRISLVLFIYFLLFYNLRLLFDRAPLFVNLHTGKTENKNSIFLQLFSFYLPNNIGYQQITVTQWFKPTINF